MEFPHISEALRLERLERPSKFPVRMVLDTDTFNEIDDQFALAYSALKKDRLTLEAVYAAPFFNAHSTSPADGMEKSYEEIGRVLALTNPSIPKYRGSDRYLPDEETPVESEGAHDLVKRAMAMPDGEPLYVAAIGAITNVASAILMQPEIIQKIVVVWLGGHSFEWDDTREFNMWQDVAAARVIFGCGVPVVHLPAMGCTSQLTVTAPELEFFLGGREGIGGYLCERVLNEAKWAGHRGAWSRVIWDISAPMWLSGTSWMQSRLVPSPVVSYEGYYSHPANRHMIRLCTFIGRDGVFTDMFKTLTGETLDAGRGD